MFKLLAWALIVPPLLGGILLGACYLHGKFVNNNLTNKFVNDNLNNKERYLTLKECFKKCAVIKGDFKEGTNVQLILIDSNWGGTDFYKIKVKDKQLSILITAYPDSEKFTVGDDEWELSVDNGDSTNVEKLISEALKLYNINIDVKI